jgi:hypothetical protein
MEGEHCQICGKEYNYVWNTSDELWKKVTGITNGSGLRCMSCFASEAEKKGIFLAWKADYFFKQ